MSKSSVRNLYGLVAAVAIGLLATAAAAQEWKPGKTVELVVGSAPGGSPDIMARLVQKIFQETKLVNNSTVVNKPGAANTIGWAYLNQHQGDGHYIATISPALISNKLMGTSDLNHLDFTPLNIMVREYVVITVKGDSTIMSMKDLTARIKKDPKSLSFAFATARGNHNHIVMSMYLKSIGVDPKTVKTVVYPGGGPALTALLGGHIDVYFSSPRSMVPLHHEKRARVLGISSAQRQKGGLAEFPTLKEQGVDAVFFTWRGFMGPKGMKPAEVAYWDTTFAKLGQSEEWRKDAESQFWGPDYLLSADTRKHMEVENETTRLILNDLGLIGSAPPGKQRLRQLPPGEKAIAYIKTQGGTREACVPGSRIVTTVINAALAGGMLAHADETDDSHAASLTHPGCGIVPAALAMAESRKAGGTALLRAVALGYDIGTRASLALGGHALADTGRDTHSIGTMFGAAAAAGSLAGFNADQARHLLSYMGNQAAGLSNYARDTEHVEKAFVFCGMPTRNRAATATMVAFGMSAIDDVFSGDRNLFVAFAPTARPEQFTRGLGETFEIVNTNIKRWTTGRPIQAPLDSLSQLIKTHKFKADDVEKVVVRVLSRGALYVQKIGSYWKCSIF